MPFLCAVYMLIISKWFRSGSWEVWGDLFIVKSIYVWKSTRVWREHGSYLWFSIRINLCHCHCLSQSVPDVLGSTPNPSEIKWKIRSWVDWISAWRSANPLELTGVSQARIQNKVISDTDASAAAFQHWLCDPKHAYWKQWPLKLNTHEN